MIKKKLISSILSAFFCVGVALPSANASGETKLLLGDANMNSTVDSADASLILSEYSTVSTGGAVTFSSLQKQCADVDENSIIDASDASYVLAYYAYIATGGTAEFFDFINGGQEQEPEDDLLALENIGTEYAAFEWHSDCLRDDIMQGYAIETYYNDYVTGGIEAEILLAMLNKDFTINNEVLIEKFSDYTDDEIRNCVKFFYMYHTIIDKTGGNPDFKQYTLNPDIGDYLNNVIHAYQTNTLDNILGDGNLKYRDNPGISAILYSYGIYSTEEEIESCVQKFIEDLIKIKNGNAS